ncbi:LPP20 family lipoprotein [Sulfurimonas sp. SAG-AH-194-L11]|nr:LPP20 family lipoprotein [Sulfurimonas sp. SAG-AH-194-L11]MDF1876440.1 LPP20 family lipoprotein [Sulfurimonas sp. SAG-AH-194-L11]
MNIFSITLTLLIFLHGCGASPAPVPKKTPPPAWVYSVLPNDTATSMYGLAIAKTREAAIKAALNDMISRLSVKIESTFQSKQKVINNYYSNTITQSDIKAKVEKVKINNYKVIKSYRISYREFAVMIVTDKQKFIKGLKEELEVKKKLIVQQMQTLTFKDKVSQYNLAKKMSKKAKALLPTVLILSTIDELYNSKIDQDFIFNIEDKFLHVSSSLKFYVHGDKKSSLFVDKIKNNLAQNNFSVVKKEDDAIDITVTTQDNINKSVIEIAVLTMKISVKEDNQRIGGKINIIKERYNSSINNVYKNAAIHFEQNILKQGINKVLGINLNIVPKVD